MERFVGESDDMLGKLGHIHKGEQGTQVLWRRRAPLLLSFVVEIRRIGMLLSELFDIWEGTGIT